MRLRLLDWQLPNFSNSLATINVPLRVLTCSIRVQPVAQTTLT
jgi:hypothetical protein